ncbi:hypothetical protein [Halovulum sp. GXIMD14793]
MRILDRSWIVNVIRAVLVIEAGISLFSGRGLSFFVALATLAITFAPAVFAKRFQIELPTIFVVWIVIFIFSTLFLGEVFDFYNRFWWWDVVLHGGSALGLGLFGFLFIFMLFQGDRFLAPPLCRCFSGLLSGGNNRRNLGDF